MLFIFNVQNIEYKFYIKIICIVYIINVAVTRPPFEAARSDVDIFQGDIGGNITHFTISLIILT